MTKNRSITFYACKAVEDWWQSLPKHTRSAAINDALIKHIGHGGKTLEDRIIDLEFEVAKLKEQS